MGKVSYQEKMLRYSNDSVTTLGDMILLAALFGVELLTPTMVTRTSVGARKQMEALSDFGEWSVNNHKRVKQTYYRLKNQGLIDVVRTKAITTPKLTELGRKRLEAVLPTYEEKRPWDGNLYVITYDIPENKRRQRDLLRDKLKKLGCGLMQNSVWITPYDPRTTLENFIASTKLATSILIADLATDNGVVGNETVPQLVERVYNLAELNEDYEEFIRIYKGDQHSVSQMYLSFLAILRGDPQLPFQLLPSDWVGDRAYQLVKKRAKNLS